MMIQKKTGFALLTGSAMLVLFFVTGAWASDIKKLVENCTLCHGRDGAGTEPDVPIIAGYSAPYLTDSMVAYRKKERPCPDTKYRGGENKGTIANMCRVAKDLSDGEIKQVAQYFAGRKFIRANQKFDPVLAKRGREIHELLCEKCHSEGGSLASDDSGILAGQWMPYLEEMFKQYNSGKRPMPKKMKTKIDKLDKVAVEALIHYYGSFK